MTTPARPRTVDSYIDGLRDERKATAQALRAAVLAADTGVTESIKWGQVVFDVAGPLAALKAHPKHVTLTFWRGAAMSDSAGKLQGDGDRMRHARFGTADSVDAAAVGALVKEAAALNRELGDPTSRR